MTHAIKTTTNRRSGTRTLTLGNLTATVSESRGRYTVTTGETVIDRTSDRGHAMRSARAALIAKAVFFS